MTSVRLQYDSGTGVDKLTTQRLGGRVAQVQEIEDKQDLKEADRAYRRIPSDQDKLVDWDEVAERLG